MRDLYFGGLELTMGVQRTVMMSRAGEAAAAAAPPLLVRVKNPV